MTKAATDRSLPVRVNGRPRQSGIRALVAASTRRRPSSIEFELHTTLSDPQVPHRPWNWLPNCGHSENLRPAGSRRATIYTMWSSASHEAGSRLVRRSCIASGRARADRANRHDLAQAGVHPLTRVAGRTRKYSDVKGNRREPLFLSSGVMRRQSNGVTGTSNSAHHRAPSRGENSPEGNACLNLASGTYWSR